MDKKIDKRSTIISGLIMVIIGLLFIIFQGKILSVLFTIFGVLLITFGIIDLLNKQNVSGLIKIILGVIIIVFGWAFVSICLYILAVVLILFGFYSLYDLLKYKTRGTTREVTVLLYLSPILDIACGIFLFINQIVAINYAFIFFGIILILDGLTLLLSTYKGE